MNEHIGNHDLRLSDWGPYTKKYIGISHIPDRSRGARFDLGVFPGLYRRKIDVPNALWESGYHPWEALPDLSYYCHRHELEWKDRVYADISFTAISEGERLIRAECVNRTDTPQNIVLHYMASIHYPQLRAHGPVLQETEARVPQRSVWIDALDYEELEFAKPRPSDRLVYDGYARGEARIQHFTRGSGLATGFGQDDGDRVRYRVPVREPMRDAVLMLRYRMEAGQTAKIRIEGLLRETATLTGDGDIQLLSFRIGELETGTQTLAIRSLGGAALELDGFALAENGDAGDVRFEPLPSGTVPVMKPGPRPDSLILQYEGREIAYGLLWGGAQSEVRQYFASELDRFMRFKAHDHVNNILRDDGRGEITDGHFANVFQRPIVLAPDSTRVLYGMVVCGTLDEVEEKLGGISLHDGALEAAVQAKRAALATGTFLPSGEPYRFSQRLMAATLLTNIVFPVYTKRSYIKHYTPGRWWDSLYTWDAGFIGLGLTELDPARAADCLNAYVAEPGDDQTAFIHHGSMVPVQHYLYQELWNKSQDKEQLAFFYPRLRQYYLFFSGQAAGSTTGVLQSNLLKTWDYFYNSGGWDDYPPQVHVHRQRLQSFVAPVITTSQAIRIAKTLVFAARELGGLEADIAGYEADIAAFGEAVNRHAWDEEAGYYGYVAHDDAGNPVGIVRHESGDNFNRGLDGTYPLVAGACSLPRGERLLRHLRDPGRLWSPIGLSAVDQSAPYYSNEGYWNGTVWMAHQWFYWKTMLDCGQADDAWRIASTALDLWKREVAETYHCFEHFIVESGRGAGWHQFGGLSSPVLNWHAAYYRMGRVTAGFDVWVSDRRFNEDYTHAELAWTHRPNDMDSAYSVLICMNPAYSYTVTEGADIVPHSRRHDGLIELRLEAGRGDRKLTIRRVASD